MEIGGHHEQNLHHNAGLQGHVLQALMNIIPDGEYDRQEARQVVGELIRFYGENIKELVECNREVFTLAGLYTSLSEFGSWNNRDVSALLQTLSGVICYRRDHETIREACQALLRVPSLVSPDDLEFIVGKFKKFPEVLAYRFSQLSTYFSQVMVLKASLKLGNKSGLLTQHQVELNPEMTAESIKLYEKIEDNNFMKSSRKFLMHYNATFGRNLRIKSMAGQVLAVNDDPLPIPRGNNTFVDFNTRESSLSVFIPAYLFEYGAAGDAAVELLNYKLKLVNDGGDDLVQVSSEQWRILTIDGIDISEKFTVPSPLKLKLKLLEMTEFKSAIMNQYREQPMEIEFTMDTKVSSVYGDVTKSIISISSDGAIIAQPRQTHVAQTGGQADDDNEGNQNQARPSRSAPTVRVSTSLKGTCTYSLACKNPRDPGFLVCEMHRATRSMTHKGNQAKRVVDRSPGWSTLNKLFCMQRVYETMPWPKESQNFYQAEVQREVQKLMQKLGSNPEKKINQVYVGLTMDLPGRLGFHAQTKPHLTQHVYIDVSNRFIAGFVETQCGFMLESAFGHRCENEPGRLGYFGSVLRDCKYFVYILFNT